MLAELNIGWFVASGCVGGMEENVRAAYDAPFPDDSYMAAARAMPNLIPLGPDDVESQPNRDAWARLSTWDKPVLVAFSDSDPITAAMAPIMKETWAGAQGRVHPTIVRAGHFLQEDAGRELGSEIAQFLAS